MGGVLTSSGNGQAGIMTLQPEAAGDVPNVGGARQIRQAKQKSNKG